MEPEEGKQVTQIIQKTTCTFFCCFRMKSSKPKQEMKAKIVARSQKRKSKRSSRFSNLPKMKVSDLSNPKYSEAINLPKDVPPPLEKQCQKPINKAAESGLTPMICSTQNIFSFKDKEYQKQQVLNMKSSNKFLMLSESRNSEDNSVVKEANEKSLEVESIQKAEKTQLKKDQEETPALSNQLDSSYLPQIKDEREKLPLDPMNLINDAEDCIRKLDNLFERQAKSLIGDNSISAVTKSKSDCEPRKIFRRKIKGKKKGKKGKKNKKKRKSTKKGEPSYNIDFWKNKVFAPRRSDCSEYDQQNCEKNQLNSLNDDEDEDMYDDFAVDY
ncbi:unnamed protein product [Moneuplotes crassus]|uniref:Uncharacterized protein n=1 Tax=Euplotes crassus TaxID=5936 RepID=A0AAD1U7Z7_EUPCR|nr:unnamed protein product [Moneuplotes crassus]